eukprot:3760958-Pyramimonas_sp.AAC.1
MEQHCANVIHVAGTSNLRSSASEVVGVTEGGGARRENINECRLRTGAHVDHPIQVALHNDSDELGNPLL